MAAKRPLSVMEELSKVSEPLATAIADKYVQWSNAKRDWETGARETMQYLYATDSRQIGSGDLNEWDNCTHIPKMAQIYDNLTSQYYDALFSTSDYVDWSGPVDAVESSEEYVDKRHIIKQYVRNMLDTDAFKKAVKEALEDYVLFGNPFLMPVYTNKTIELPDGSTKEIFSGVEAKRISPLDIVFDATAKGFDVSAKILREVTDLGSLKANMDQFPEEASVIADAFKKALKKRKFMREACSGADTIKDNELSIAGVGGINEYMAGDTVELLTFYGDLYDVTADKLYKNHKIVVMDRTTVLFSGAMDTLSSLCRIRKGGWRDRKDCLWSQGPLDNLKGMQYRIDNLENKKADVLDFVTNPMVLIKGDVPNFPATLAPGVKIEVPLDGDVSMLPMDMTILTTESQISMYEDKMEEMAGSPKESMGFRTPGEKTAFEFNQLVTAAARLFNVKIKKFETEVFTPLINDMLQLELLNKKGTTAVIDVIDKETGATIKQKIEIDDILGQGKIKAVGSEHFAEKAKLLQTIVQLGNSAVYNDPAVKNNIDPKIMAQIIVYSTGLDRYQGLFRDKCRIFVEADQARTAEMAAQEVDKTVANGLKEVQDVAPNRQMPQA